MDKAAAEGGSVLAIGSPRTPRDLLRAIGPLFQSTSVPILLVPSEGSPTYSALVAAADEIFVTADSVAMVADAVTTGKPVGLIPIEKSALGSMVMASMDRLRPGRRLYPRDLRFFWRALEEQGYAGTLDAPRAISPPDYLELVADRVRLLFEQPRPPATGARGSDR
jgi:mitochondrial fission protein ELM1